MKKFIAIITLVSMLSLAGCGNAASSSDSAADTNSKAENSKVTETVNDSAEDKAEETPEDTQPEETSSGKTYGEDYLDWHGMKLFIPAQDMSDRTNADGQPLLQSRDSLTFPSWREAVGTGSDVDTTKAYAVCVGHGFDGKEALSAEEAKQYFFDHLDVPQIIDKNYDCDAILSVDIEKSETVQVLGKDFLRESGIMHCGSLRGDGDIAFVAYYGTPGFTEDMYTTAPVMWIAYSNHLDDDTKAVLAEMADKAANDAEING